MEHDTLQRQVIDFSPFLHVEKLIKPGWEVVVVCFTLKRYIRRTVKWLSGELVWTTSLCWISGETYCQANPKMIFVFGLKQSTSAGSS